jgi:AcrR family transcriptional regulator
MLTWRVERTMSPATTNGGPAGAWSLRRAASSKERGYGGVGVDGVMEAEGLTVGGFYAHFPAKEALLEEALRQAMAETRRRFFGRDG